MKREILPVVLVLSVVILGGCSAFSPQDSDNSTAGVPTPTSTSTSTEVPESTEPSGTDTPQSDDSSTSRDREVVEFEEALRDSGVTILEARSKNRTLYVDYQGNFSDYEQTSDDIATINQEFSKILNYSEVRNDSGSFERMVVGGYASPQLKVWQFRTESWWAVKYRQTDWERRDFVNATLATGEQWNLATQKPPQYGDAYMSELRSRLETQTDIEIETLEQHGAEAFLTYETDRDSDTNEYYAQVVNVSDVYRNFTLPRRLDQTGGWYAGVLNVEVRDRDETVEWFRYRIWWAEEVSKDDLSRRGELHYLLSDSRFPKSD